MLILLPPSETKRTGGGAPYRAEDLAHGEHLAGTRAAVRTALEELSLDEDIAAKALGLGVKARGELEHNRVLESSGALEAMDRYTGVLYDALDAASLDEDARDWMREHVAVQSALFGLVRAGDRIPAYRLSAGSRLAALDAPLKRSWVLAHADMDWASHGWILDLRSNDYAALAPLPEGVGTKLEVAQRSADGAVRALNHFNKTAKGDLVRRLARSGAELDGPETFAGWAQGQGLEVQLGEKPGSATLVTELGAPAGVTGGAGSERAAR